MGTGELVLERKVKKGTAEMKVPMKPKNNKVVQCGDPDDKWPWATPAPDKQSGGKTYGFIA